MPKSQKTGLKAPTAPVVPKPTLSKVKMNRHGRCFKSHLRLRHKAIIGARPVNPLVAVVKMDLAARKAVAADARQSGPSWSTRSAAATTSSPPPTRRCGAPSTWKRTTRRRSTRMWARRMPA